MKGDERKMDETRTTRSPKRGVRLSRTMARDLLEVALLDQRAREKEVRFTRNDAFLLLKSSVNGPWNYHQAKRAMPLVKEVLPQLSPKQVANIVKIVQKRKEEIISEIKQTKNGFAMAHGKVLTYMLEMAEQTKAEQTKIETAPPKPRIPKILERLSDGAVLMVATRTYKTLTFSIPTGLPEEERLIKTIERRLGRKITNYSNYKG